jgi:hypothetical protein
MGPNYANLFVVLWKNRYLNNTLIPSLITLIGT